MTAFMMPFGLMRMATLLQGYTNGVQVFDRVIHKVLQEQITQGWAKPLIDDVGIKPFSQSFYRVDGKFKEVVPGVKKCVMEAIVSLDETLADIEQSSGTIMGEKRKFLKDGIKMVAFICGSQERTSKEAKIKKIVNWKACASVMEVKGFLGLCVFYQIWIRYFAVRANPLYLLTCGKNNSRVFEWGLEQQDAIDDLKRVLTQAPALKPIDYQEGRKIVLSVDSSLIG